MNRLISFERLDQFEWFLLQTITNTFVTNNIIYLVLFVICCVCFNLLVLTQLDVSRQFVRSVHLTSLNFLLLCLCVCSLFSVSVVSVCFIAFSAHCRHCCVCLLYCLLCSHWGTEAHPTLLRLHVCTLHVCWVRLWYHWQYSITALPGVLKQLPGPVNFCR